MIQEKRRKFNITIQNNLIDGGEEVQKMKAKLIEVKQLVRATTTAFIFDYNKYCCGVAENSKFLNELINIIIKTEILQGAELKKITYCVEQEHIKSFIKSIELLYHEYLELEKYLDDAKRLLEAVKYANIDFIIHNNN